MGKRIPIKEAENIAKKYGYEQVVILAQKPYKSPDWADGWTTTYNIDKTKCKFLGKIGTLLISYLRGFYLRDEEVTDDYLEKVK